MKLNKNELIRKAANLLLIATLCLVSISALVKQKKVKCEQVVIDLHPAEGTYFLETKNVAEIAANVTLETAFLGKSLQELQTDKMLFNLSQSPFVKQANILFGHDGKLIFKVEQRKPLFRVINQQGKSYYVEKNGMKIPFVKKHTVRVPVLTGAITESTEDSSYIHTPILKEAHLIFKYIEKDAFWLAQIEQVYVDKIKGFLLIPKVGNHTIVVGNSERIEEKFDMLKTFYHEGLSKTGWDVYREIDLSFKGQIVARRWKVEE